MKNVKEVLGGNIKEYEELISMLYQIENLTGEKMENVIAKLDNLYDKNNLI